MRLPSDDHTYSVLTPASDVPLEASPGRSGSPELINGQARLHWPAARHSLDGFFCVLNPGSPLCPRLYLARRYRAIPSNRSGDSRRKDIGAVVNTPAPDRLIRRVGFPASQGGRGNHR